MGRTAKRLSPVRWSCMTVRPSGNAMAALVLLRLSRETGEDVWKARVEGQLTFLRRAVPMTQATGYSFSGYVLLEAEEKAGKMQAVFTKDS